MYQTGPKASIPNEGDVLKPHDDVFVGIAPFSLIGSPDENRITCVEAKDIDGSVVTVVERFQILVSQTILECEFRRNAIRVRKER